MNPEQERKAKEKQLQELEQELGLVSRRALNALITDTSNNLKHLERLANVNAYEPSHAADVRQVYHNWRRHMSAMIKRIETRS